MVVKYYADDAVSHAPNKPAARGKAAILSHIKEQMAEDTTSTTVQFEVVDVFAQGNLAVEVGKSTATHKRWQQGNRQIFRSLRNAMENDFASVNILS